ncbi:MAG: hypothetical protein KAH20_03010 [Methylococcales bacterium]|nr:hypothetical protein [Methylococcales bacterium]
MFNNLFKKKATSKGIVALSFTSEGISLAISKHTVNLKPKLTHCEFIRTNKKQETLQDLSAAYQLKDYDCYLILTPDDYRLITIEPPAVTENEMTEAIRWKISDLVEFNVDDAIIDYYPLPVPQRVNSEKKIEIIAAPKSIIQPLIDLCISCDLQLKVIDIQETNIRNLATLAPENISGFAVLYLQKNTGQIIIEQEGLIYLNRKLAIGFDRLGLTDSFLSDGQIELEQSSLALDIQRSFDYVESYYNLPPISELAVIPIIKNTQGILDFINKNQGITSRIMDLSSIIDSNLLLNDSTQSLCASVIGATLRNALKPS